jgi:hypothetical protein
MLKNEATYYDIYCVLFVICISYTVVALSYCLLTWYMQRLHYNKP